MLSVCFCALSERFELEEAQRKLREYELRMMRIAEEEMWAWRRAEAERLAALKPLMLDLATRCAAVVRVKQRQRVCMGAP